MTFGDVKTPQGLKELNNLLADNSYISGYEPSKADLSVFDALGKAPTGDLPHVQHWCRHIASFEASEKAAWVGAPLPQVAGAKSTVTVTASAADDDDGVDLSSSDDEENAEAAKTREERVAAYAAKKSMKPALIAKSSVFLDVKSWDDAADMKEMEKQVRTIEMDDLLWGASKFVPVGYGINKLQIMCVIVDEKVFIDLLTEKIQEFEDFVQFVDIAAFKSLDLN